MVSAPSSSLGRHRAGPDPEDSSGGSRAVVSASASGLGRHRAGLTPRTAQGVPGHGLCSSLQPQWTLGWPDPEARKGAALGPVRAEVTVLSPQMEQSTPAELHGEPVRGQDARCADTGQAASSPRGHRAGGPRTAEEMQADRQPHLTARCTGRTNVTKHQYFSAHARGRACTMAPL